MPRYRLPSPARNRRKRQQSSAAWKAAYGNGYHRIGHRKVIRREDELIRPAFILLQMAVCADGALYRTHHRSTCGTHLPVQILGTVYNLYGFFRNNHLLGIRLMLGKVLYIDVAEVAQTGMQCNIGKVNSP